MGAEGREAQEGGDICTIMADLHFCMQKPTQHYKAVFLQLKINLKKIAKKEQNKEHYYKGICAYSQK